jgi:hypothetical protein
MNGNMGLSSSHPATFNIEINSETLQFSHSSSKSYKLNYFNNATNNTWRLLIPEYYNGSQGTTTDDFELHIRINNNVIAKSCTVGVFFMVNFSRLHVS